jgi:hypothetical protein
LIVGIRLLPLRSFLKPTPGLPPEPSAEPRKTIRQTDAARTRAKRNRAIHPGGGRRLAVQRTTAGIGRGRAPESDYRSTSAAAFELHSSRLGVASSAADKISDLKGLADLEAGRSDWRSSPPAESAAYLSTLDRSVKAERAGNAEDSRLRTGWSVNSLTQVDRRKAPQIRLIEQKPQTVIL